MDIYLDGENISKGGTVEFIKCVNCGHEGISLHLLSDTDMVYQRVIGHGSKIKKELVLTRLTKDEYNSYARLTGRELSARINATFNREDLEYFKSGHFIRSDGDKIWANICPTCDSYFELQKSMDFDQFIKEGGRIVCYSIHDRKMK